ncbi:hypothetical protein L218DRAFT_683513 [Marasmius fiardii PR-910]|nr:hypothetical protein L218DRAFT_683513 [Marasmius fiardii PR-910]
MSPLRALELAAAHTAHYVSLMFPSLSVRPNTPGSLLCCFSRSCFLISLDLWHQSTSETFLAGFSCSHSSAARAFFALDMIVPWNSL